LCVFVSFCFFFVFLCFFFSSRRRHTRFLRDWSSDVCSSDLRPRAAPLPTGPVHQRHGGDDECSPTYCTRSIYLRSSRIGPASMRSEERRVGKEGRSGWSPYQ